MKILILVVDVQGNLVLHSKTIAMTYTTEVSPATIQQWLADKFNTTKIEQELTVKGCDAATIEAYINAFKKARNAKRQVMGFTCLGIGGFLGFISCILTIINPIPEWYNLILYGLTSVAVLVVFAGLYYLLE
jgi:hypothetical protein